MRDNLIFSLLLVFLASLYSCGGKAGKQSEGGDTLKLKYSHLLHIAEVSDGVRVTVDDPWSKGRILRRYLLAERGRSLTDADTAGCTVVRVPLRRTVVFSSVHLGLIDALGAGGAVAGLTDARYVTMPRLRRLIKERHWRDLGMSLSPDVEGIVSLHPDALLVSPFEGSGTYGALGDTGIPLIECADYMEPTPLGRAEWMRFYGRLLGIGERADSLFAATEKRYLALRDRAARCSERPLVMTDKVENGTWYIPGAESTIGRIIADAGARYTGSGLKKSGAVSVTLEQMLATARNADFWIIRSGGKYDLTYSSLLRDNSGYALFRPWMERRIFACNTLKVPFFDDEPFHPERMLSDLINIFHPGITGDKKMYYFSPLRP